MAWLANFDAHWHEIADRYNERTRRMFRYYLSVCAGAFRLGTCSSGKSSIRIVGTVATTRLADPTVS